ncbi:cation channel sperm-associated protein 2-like isoform X2 [Macrotis lagotis]|uniref:cation channel sperm-associated protein 2-like isoform X2 n=1 Tax=Macrotis lagotis TaxID=92651 RepID=UPI003D694CB6
MKTNEPQETSQPKGLSRADAVRSRLIDTFSLIEHLRGLSQAVPRHNLREFLDPARQKKLMLGDHHQLVRFSIRPGHGRILFAQRQQCRLTVRYNPWAPISLWAGWVLERRFFVNLIIFLIFMNTVLLMLEIELVNSRDVKMLPVMLALEVASWFILFIFMLEIILMWLFNFVVFWKSVWNLFDFFVTVMSLVPEIIVLVGVSGTSMWLQLLRICRVLRSLKLFVRFRQIRVIILALVRALKTMTSLLALLLIFFYIFALAGVYFFDYYTRSTIQDLEYQMYFSDMPNSLVTVFILFTLDHWYALLQDAWRVPGLSKAFSSIYVILWLLLGSIIFRNIIVAMMVTNFQAIRNELIEEAAYLEVQHKADAFKRQIIKRRLSQKEGGKTKSKITGSSQTISKASPQIEESDAPPIENKTADSKDNTTAPQESPFPETLSSVDWETHVHQNLPGLMEMDKDEQVVWPRDSLFRYFELLEKLQYNIEERKHLQDFAVKALINLTDR